MKAIAIDMDGTLLTAAQYISEENRKAIKAAQQKGIEVIVATGRSYEEASFVLKDSGVSCPMICVNGAEVRAENGEILTSNPIPADRAKQAARILDEHQVYYEVYTNKGTFTVDVDKAISIIVDIFSTANPEIDVDVIVKGAEVRFEKGLVHKIDHYDELFVNPEYKIYKLLAFSLEPSHLGSAKQNLEKMVAGMVISSSGSENIEITSDAAEKGIALDFYTKQKGIRLKETMAIGDNYNDLSMFKRAGRSVAMGNASDVIKMQCDFVTLTNEEDGVAKAIYEVL